VIAATPTTGDCPRLLTATADVCVSTYVRSILIIILQHLTYCQRLARLQLESLELRRLRLDLIFTYKLVFGLIDVDVSDFFRLRCDDRNRGHRYKLFLPGCRSSVRQHFLSYRAVQTWNNLPADGTDFSNLSSFKCGLNSSFLARHSAVYYF